MLRQDGLGNRDCSNNLGPQVVREDPRATWSRSEPRSKRASGFERSGADTKVGLRYLLATILERW